MITQMGAEKLETRIRRRIEDASDAFVSDEILDAVQSALSMLYTKMRLAGKMHNTAVLLGNTMVQTQVRQKVVNFTLPETVSQVIKITGQRGSGNTFDLFNKVPVQVVDQTAGAPHWIWLGSRPGIIQIHGTLTRYTSIEFTVTRTWPPLHYGTAAAGGASTITFAAAATAGDVIRRNDVYIGLDVLLTSDTPPGTQDQIGRIIDYVGSTRVATVAPAWTTAPDVTTQYSIVAPIEEEYKELLIEESAQILKEELGEGLPPSPRLGELRTLFTQGLSQRDGEPARRLFSRGL